MSLLPPGGKGMTILIVRVVWFQALSSDSVKRIKESAERMNLQRLPTAGSLHVALIGTSVLAAGSMVKYYIRSASGRKGFDDINCSAFVRNWPIAVNRCSAAFDRD